MGFKYLISQVKNPTKVPFTADSFWMMGWPEDTGVPAPNGLGELVTGPPGGDSGDNTFSQFLFGRHPGTTVNASFIDGQSETV